ncbi:MAG TPA: hypothetical protein VN033_15045 [Vulgatibacter sp.]|nr:hypothetical protein [Vulgatibacter sp.]
MFVDCCLAHHVAAPLVAAGLVVHLHDDHFEPGTPDEVWLVEAGRRKWLVLTKDLRIRTNLLQRNALYAAGVGAFFLKGGNATSAQMAALVHANVDRLIAFAKKHPTPFIASVTNTGIRLVEQSNPR